MNRLLVIAALLVSVLCSMVVTALGRTVVSQSGHTYAFEDSVWVLSSGEDSVLVDSTRVSIHSTLGTTLTQQFLDQAGFPDAHILFDDLAGDYYVLAIPDTVDSFAYLDSLESQSAFDWVRFDLIGSLFSVPNDPLFEDQWSFASSTTSTIEAWDLQRGSGSVPIAIVDSGIDIGNEDIHGMNPNSEVISATPGTGFSDECGHGTAVAGIVGALTNNNLGVAGVSGLWNAGSAQNLVVMKIKTGTGCYPANICDLGRAIKKAADNGAKVVNVSAGIPVKPITCVDFEAQIDYAVDVKDVVIVCAAGQGLGSGRALAYPASSEKTIGVGGLLEDESPVGFWKQGVVGADLDIMAPSGDIGVGIVTTDIHGPGGLDPADYTEDFGGTSAASPFVAGVAGLVRAADPALSWTQVRAIIRGSGVRLPAMIGTFDPEYGYGMVNTNRALLYPLLSSPTGGEVFEGRDTLVVSWRTASDNADVRSQVYLSTDGELSYSPLTAVIVAPGHSSSFEWVVPNDLNTNEAYVKVVSWNVNHTSDPKRHFASSSVGPLVIKTREWEAPGDRSEIATILEELAEDGDRIIVSEKAGSQPYLPIVVDKAVEIVAGIGKPEIDGGTESYAVDVQDPAARVVGLAITGGAVAAARLGGDGIGGNLSDCVVNLGAGGPQIGISIASGSVTSCSVDVSAVSDATGVHMTGTGSLVGSSVVASSGIGIYLDECVAVAEECTVSVNTGAGVSMASGNSVLRNSRVEVTSSEGINHGIVISGFTPDVDIVEGCFLSVPGGYGIFCLAESGEVRNCTIDGASTGIYYSNGLISKCIAVNCSNKGFDKAGSAGKAILCISPDGFGGGSRDQSSREEDPLFCSSGVYTLRVDSWGNPRNNGSGLIGAFPVACMEGTILGGISGRASVEVGPEDSFAERDTVTVSRDVLIPSGVSVALHPGATILISDMDEENLGGDSTKIEILVDGNLSGAIAYGNDIILGSETGWPEGTWGGIEVGAGGHLNLDGVTLRQATTGILMKEGADEPLWLSNCVLVQNETDIDSDVGVDLSNNTISVGPTGSGVIVNVPSSSSAVDIDANTITGSPGANHGVVIRGVTGDGETLIRNNTIYGFATGDGIKIEAHGKCIIRGNVIHSCKTAILAAREATADTSSCAPQIGSSGGGNTLSANTLSGLRILKEKTLPKVRSNAFTGNAIGIFISKQSFANLGPDTTDPGMNSFQNSELYCIQNMGTMITHAVGNYFGGNGTGCAAPGCGYGPIDASSWLCNDPMGIFLEKELVIGALPGFRFLGVSPNPMHAVTKIRFAVRVHPREVRIEIVDVTGRMVRNFGSVVAPVGVSEVMWDGRSDRSRAVANGIYFIRIVTGEHTSMTMKLLKLL